MTRAAWSSSWAAATWSSPIGEVEPPAPSTELWLQVRDVRRAEQELRAAGVPIIESAVEKPWGLIELRVSDPDGLVLILVEVPPDHPLRLDQRSI